MTFSIPPDTHPSYKQAKIHFLFRKGCAIIQLFDFIEIFLRMTDLPDQNCKRMLRLQRMSVDRLCELFKDLIPLARNGYM